MSDSAAHGRAATDSAARHVASVRVRAAGSDDADGIATVQTRAWSAGYAALMPPDRGLLRPADVAQSWAAAIAHPPSPRHRVLVALAGPAVVAFAAYGPAGDPDTDPQSDAEVVALHVDPDHVRAGHGSRLMAATVEHLRADRFTRALTWVFTVDDPLRGFLVAAGWGPDGATRDLDVGILEHQVRLHVNVEH